MVLELINNYKIKYLWLKISWILFLSYCIIFSLGYLQSIDTHVYQFLSSFQNSSLTIYMKIITFFGSTLGIILVCLLCLINDWKIGFMMSIHVAIVAIINQIMKILIARPRPDVLPLVIERGFSFPSAHAMVSFILYGMIAYFFWNKKKIISLLLFFVILLIGVSRIYLGVHYTSDVIGGYLFSFAYLNTVFIFMKNHKWLSYT